MRLVDHPALVAAARRRLEPAKPVRVRASDSDYLIGCARTDRLAGLLADALLAGTVVVEPETESSVRDLWHSDLDACVRLEALTVRVAGLLDEAGIAWRLSKGAALAHLDYPDPSLRTFGDVDIVVRPAQWTIAFELLSVNGYRRAGSTLPGRYDDRYGKGATFLTEEGLEIDVHRRFAAGRFGVRSRMDDLFAGQDSITLGGREIPCLDPVGRLLHACFHAMLGRGALLRAYRDIAQLVIVTGADWEKTFAIGRSWRAEAVVATAIKETWERLELTVEHPAHERALAARISDKDAQVLERFPSMPFRQQALSAIPRLPPLDIPRYLWTLGAARRQRQSVRHR